MWGFGVYLHRNGRQLKCFNAWVGLESGSCILLWKRTEVHHSGLGKASEEAAAQSSRGATLELRHHYWTKAFWIVHRSEDEKPSSCIRHSALLTCKNKQTKKKWGVKLFNRIPVVGFSLVIVLSEFAVLRVTILAVGESPGEALAKC